MDVQPPTPAVLLEQARSAYRREQFYDAITFCRQGVALPALSIEQIDGLYDVYAHSLVYVRQTEDAIAALRAWAERSHTTTSQVDRLLIEVRIERAQGNMPEALQKNEQAVQLATQHGYRNGLAMAFLFRGDTYSVQGKSEAAVDQYRRALALFEEVHNTEYQIYTYWSLGFRYTLGGEYQRAIQNFQRAAAISERMPDQPILWQLYSNLGEIYESVFAWQKALYYNRRALELTHDQMMIGDLLRHLGICLVATGETEAGLQHLERALDQTGKTGTKFRNLQVICSMAEVYHDLGRREQAQQMAEQALAESRQLDMKPYVARALFIVGYLAMDVGDIEAAQKHFQESFLIAQQIDDKSLIWRAHAAMSTLLQGKQPALARVHRDIAIAIIEHIAASLGDLELRDTFMRARPVARLFDG